MVAVLSFEFLADYGWLPQLLTYSPEVLAMVAGVLVIVAGVRSRFKYVRPAYWLVFGGLLLIIVCGAVVNHLEPGPIFAGLRTYLRALPFFFLPAVLEIKERQLRVQLLLLLVIGLLQLPIAWDQRMVTFTSGPATGDSIYAGDSTYGTLMSSSFLTLYLVSAVCVLTGFFLRKRISTKWFFPLIVLLLLPTTINETKAALFIVPVALFTCFLIGSKPGTRVTSTVVAAVITVSFVAVFIPVYDHFMEPRWGYGILDFLTMEGRLEGYLDKGTGVGEYEEKAGKIGGLRIAISEISRDPAQFVFGLGIGNVSDSALGHQFTGKYYKLYELIALTSAIHIVFELGAGGLGLVLILYWFLFRDSISVAHHDQGMNGALAIGWAGVVVVMLIGLFYHYPIESRGMSVLFWYFSGLIAAYRMRLVSGAFDASTDSAVSRQCPPISKVDTTA